MKIALIIRQLNNRGGAQRQFLSLAVELQQLGHKVAAYVFKCRRESSFPDMIDKLRIIELPSEERRNADGPFGFLAEDRMARSLALLIDRDTDLLNPHDFPAHHVSYYFKKYVRQIPSVWQLNELPFMRWPPEWEMEIDPRFHDSPPRSSRHLKRFFYLLKGWYDRSFVRAQDALTVFDSAHQASVKRYLKRESFIAHSGVDSHRFPFSARTPPGKDFSILSSGIFLPYRRFEDIIQALPILADWGYNPRLTIVGEYNTDKKYRRALEDLASELNVANRVAMVGRVSDEELERLLTAHHLFVFPHLQSQAISVYEAMSTGLATIAARIPGAYETLTDGSEVILIPPKDPAAIARAIKNLIDDPELYQRIGAAGAKLVREHFSWRRYTEEMIKAFELVSLQSRE